MIYTVGFFSIGISVILTLIRLIKGPNGADRIMSIDLLTTLLACFILLYILKTGELIFLDTPLVLTLIAFFGTLMYSRYLEKKIESRDSIHIYPKKIPLKK
jgi:multicomponent Na+:H+ antiporter subunit F